MHAHSPGVLIFFCISYRSLCVGEGVAFLYVFTCVLLVRMFIYVCAYLCACIFFRTCVRICVHSHNTYVQVL